MSRAQRQRASEHAASQSALQAALESFRANPCALSPHVVDALLGELCGDLGVCLTPDGFESVLANPPTDPLTFAELVARLEAGVDDPELVEMILPRVLRTFEGAARDADADVTEPSE